MIKNVLTFIYDLNGNFIGKSTGEIRGWSNAKDYIYLVNPYTCEHICKATFFMCNSSTSEITRMMRSTPYKGSDVIDSNQHYFEMIKEWNVWEIELSQDVLASIPRSVSGILNVSFSIQEPVEMGNALLTTSTEGISVDPAAYGELDLGSFTRDDIADTMSTYDLKQRQNREEINNLKPRVENIETSLLLVQNKDELHDSQIERLILENKGTRIPSFDFGVSMPTKSQIDNHAILFSNPIINGIQVKNLYDNRVWVFSSVNDSWINWGIDNTSQATNEILGTVKGSLDEDKVSVNSDTGEMVVNGIPILNDKIIELRNTHTNDVGRLTDTVNRRFGIDNKVPEEYIVDNVAFEGRNLIELKNYDANAYGIDLKSEEISQRITLYGTSVIDGGFSIADIPLTAGTYTMTYKYFGGEAVDFGENHYICIELYNFGSGQDKFVATLDQITDTFTITEDIGSGTYTLLIWVSGTGANVEDFQFGLTLEKGNTSHGYVLPEKREPQDLDGKEAHFNSKNILLLNEGYWNQGLSVINQIMSFTVPENNAGSVMLKDWFDLGQHNRMFIKAELIEGNFKNDAWLLHSGNSGGWTCSIDEALAGKWVDLNRRVVSGDAINLYWNKYFEGYFKIKLYIGYEAVEHVPHPIGLGQEFFIAGTDTPVGATVPRQTLNLFTHARLEVFSSGVGGDMLVGSTEYNYNFYEVRNNGFITLVCINGDNVGEFDFESGELSATGAYYTRVKLYLYRREEIKGV